MKVHGKFYHRIVYLTDRMLERVCDPELLVSEDKFRTMIGRRLFLKIAQSYALPEHSPEVSII